MMWGIAASLMIVTVIITEGTAWLCESCRELM